MKKHELLLVAALMLGTCSVAAADCDNFPSAWINRGGRPIPADVYDRAVQACRGAADFSAAGNWRLQFVACMRKHGFKPFYHGIFC